MLPEVVREDKDGFLSIDYVEIIPVLIEAFNQHMEAYHKQQKELKTEFESWRRLLNHDKKHSVLTNEFKNEPGSRASTELSDAELDSLDQSSVDEDSTRGLSADCLEYETNLDIADERGSLLVVDLDQLVSNRRNLQRLAAQMNKLIPDRQFTDVLQYVPILPPDD